MRIGADLVDVARFAPIAAHPRGRRLIFTDAELAVADTLGERRRGEYLAGRFCAKEAVAKALGRGLGQGLAWRDIEVLGDAHGAPVVTMRGGALAIATRQRVERIELSLSHQSGLVFGVAVAVLG
ncbi:holo-ACP synthase [Micromonospora sp. CPCC 205371]|nr:holo-ACP synthase [Micromonospora sp. CPCC 205371]